MSDQMIRYVLTRQSGDSIIIRGPYPPLPNWRLPTRPKVLLTATDEPISKFVDALYLYFKLVEFTGYTAFYEEVRK